jgi:hypothetical protein
MFHAIRDWVQQHKEVSAGPLLQTIENLEREIARSYFKTGYNALN